MENKEVKRPAVKGDYAFGCNDCGKFAWWRKCFWPAENKGSFTPGRGYTSYYKVPIKNCGTRMNHGCPHTNLSEVDPKSVYLTMLQPEPDWDETLLYFKEAFSAIKINTKASKLVCFVFSVINEMIRYGKAKDALIKRLEEENKKLNDEKQQ